MYCPEKRAGFRDMGYHFTDRSVLCCEKHRSRCSPRNGSSTVARTYDARETRRARIGAVIIAVALAVSVGVFFLDAIIRATTEGPRIRVATESAPGVEPGTAVRVAGRDVGRVISVEFGDPIRGRDRVIIEAVLERGVESFIRADATVAIQPGALLEPVIISIHPGTASFPQWDIEQPFVTGTGAVGPDALLELTASLADAGDMLRGEAERLRTAIRTGEGTLASMTASTEPFDETRQLAARVRERAKDEFARGTVARLASDTIIGPHLEAIRGRLAVLDTIDARATAVESFGETRRALDDFRERLGRLSERIAAGEGSAGRWKSDGALRRQVDLLRARIDSVTVELMKDPGTWLRVKVF